jgi:hypothetical protein
MEVTSHDSEAGPGTVGVSDDKLQVAFPTTDPDTMRRLNQLQAGDVIRATGTLQKRNTAGLERIVMLIAPDFQLLRNNSATQPQRRRSGEAQPRPGTAPKELRTKLLVKGSYNAVFIYGDSGVAIRGDEPFTVTSENEHSHIALPDSRPVDVAFEGHDNVVWCRDRSMVGEVTENGSKGNKFELRKSDQ